MLKPVRSSKGFTLIELLVVIMISGIFMIGVVAVFGNQTKATALQEDYAALEQNLRAATDFIVRDSRMAGAFTREVFPPFTIGAIDYNLDGTTDFNSEGGANPDAIQIRYAYDQGLQIMKFQGNANHLWLCSPSGLRAGQVLKLSRYVVDPKTHLVGSDLVIETRTITNIDVGSGCGGIPCPNSCEKVFVNNDLIAPGGKYEGGFVWPSLEAITYFIPVTGSANYPALMRVRNDELPAVVAFGVTNLQIVYIRDDGSEITAITTPDPIERKKILLSIRRVRISITGETRNAHSLGGEAPSKKVRTMTTEVQVRNLAF